jgi:hypothetical protein
MKNKSEQLPHNLHHLNIILSECDDYKQYSNKLFDNLIIPPGFCVKKNKKNIKNIKNIKNNFLHHNKYINDKLHSNLLKLVEYKDPVKLTRKSKSKKNINNTRKH